MNNNKMLMALCIFGSVNLVNAMDNADVRLHADNTVKAIVESSKKSATKDIFEVLRLSAQNMSSQDKKWCKDCIELFNEINRDAVPDADLDEILAQQQRSTIAFRMAFDCVLPFQLAVEPADIEKEIDALLGANVAYTANLKSELKKISAILEESEAQNKIAPATLTPTIQPVSESESQSEIELAAILENLSTGISEQERIIKEFKAR
jgi:hypothetical protein